MSKNVINLPDVVSEVRKIFYEYETALMSNDLVALRGYFWDSPHVTRYGIADRQWGIDQLDDYRQSVPAPSFTRVLENLRITTIGDSMATAQVEFLRTDSVLRGFQTQTWVRFDQEWKIISAHVSMIPWDS